MSRLNEEQESWSPNSMYSSLGGSQGSSYSTVSYGSVASGDAVGQINSGASSMFRHRAAFSYAHAGASSSAITSSPMASMPQGGLYATSSAEFHSFGGGNTGGVSISGGAVSAASPSASATGLTTTMPSTSMYAYANNRIASSVVTNDLMSSVSGDIAMASSQAYAGIGNTTKGIAGRKNVPGIGGEWTGWLDTEWSGGSNDITLEMLEDLYAKMTGDTDFSNQEQWYAFLAWFEGNQSNENFGWYWAPISDAVPFMLFLCLAYALYVYFRTKKAKALEGEK